MSLDSAMAHFYFHVLQDKTLFEDRRGGEFFDLKAAWHWAESDARYMIQEGQLSGPAEKCWMEICDITGSTVASFPFVRVLN
jgi:hypothetical protein